MALTQEDIQGIAKLARLKLTPDEEIRYAEELSAVLTYVDMLNEVDTEGTEETTQVTGLVDVMRDDRALEPDDTTRAKIIQLFPKVERSMLSVPPVFEDQ